jgi:hypothetical protein
MSLTPTAPRVIRTTADARGPGSTRRVREQARDVVALMAFSAVSSVSVACGFLLLARLIGAGR